MKTTRLIVALALLTMGTTSAWASAKTENKQTKGLKKVGSSQLVLPHKEKNVALTGSYIRRDVRRQGAVTNGPHPVYVIDQQSIDVTGAADLSQVLLRSGFRR